MTAATDEPGASPAVRAWVAVAPARRAALRAQLDEAIAQWPAFTVDRAGLCAALCAGLDAEPARIADRHAADLALVQACAAGDAAAILAFDQHALTALPMYLARLRPTPGEVDELRQHLRTHLLVAEPGAAPRIAQYAGDGDLRGWVRVAAVRALLDRRRRATPAAASDDLEQVADALDPTLAALKASYRAHFRAAIRVAIGELPERARLVLRLGLGGMTLAEIGALHGVHEATASRWAAAARVELGQRTRAALRARLGLADDDVASALRLIESQLDASLSGALAATAAPSEKK